MQSHRYHWPHLIATVVGLATVGFQAANIIETMPGATPIVMAGIILAVAVVGLVPTLGDAAYHIDRSRKKALALWLSAAVLVAYVLPAGVSRFGEQQEGRHQSAKLSADARAVIERDLAKADKLVAEAQAWAATACKAGAKSDTCTGQSYTLAQRTSHRDKLRRDLAADRPEVAPWLPTWHPALLGIGLELTTWACLWFGFGPLIRRAAAENRPEPIHIIPIDAAPAPAPALNRDRDFDEHPLTEAEARAIASIIPPQGFASQRQLADALGVSEGQVSKMLTAAETAGAVRRERVNGRQNRILAVA